MKIAPTLDAARAAIPPLYRRPEGECLKDLAADARLSPEERERALTLATRLLKELRSSITCRRAAASSSCP